jgi:signal transduction histidine kinase
MNKRGSFTISLRRRLRRTFISLALIPIAGVSVYSFYLGLTSEIQNSLHVQEQVASYVAANIENTIAIHLQEIKVVEYGLPAPPFEEIPKSIFLNSFLAISDSYLSVALLSPDGEVLFQASDHYSTDSLWVDQDDLQAPQREKRTYITPITFSQILREPVFSIIEPIIDLRTDEIAYLIIAELRVREIWSFLQALDLPGEITAYITNSDGQIFAHPNPSIVLQGTKTDILLEEQPRSFFKKQVLYFYMPLKIQNQVFYIITEQPVFALLDTAMGTLAISLIIMILALVVTFWIETTQLPKIIRPIEKLASSAQAISQGDFSQQIEFPPTKDELYNLAASFDDMQSQLQTLLANLREEVAERQRAEEQLRELNLNLEGRIRSRAAQLQARNIELQEFAYAVSHDLKAPLRGIRQIAEWLSKDYENVLDEEGKELLGMISTRTQRMNNLIDGILAYSRIGREEESVQEIDLVRLVKAVSEGLGVPDHITVNISEELPHVLGNPIRFEQVFLNLLDNAVKFMDKPNGLITVKCAEKTRVYQFSVSDNGAGIDPKYHEKIFKIFQTLAPSQDDENSTGIGLALVHKIVDTWNGETWIESSPGQGSTFYFTYPKGAYDRNDN